MNTNYRSNIAAGWHRQILSAVCLSAFLLITTAFARTPTLRANGKIAFTSDRDGNLEIYVMNSDGTGQVRLTNNTDMDFLPAFSPDGRKIAFVSQQTSGALTTNIKMMNADGTNQTVLTPITLSSYTHPWREYEPSSLSWSPDGSMIAFDDAGEIFTINVIGGNRTNLTNHPATDKAPAWSPDGSRILFDSSRVGYLTMHRMNAADGSDVRMLPSNFYWWDASPDWSPTSDKIVFVELSEDWHPRIYTANADGTNRQVFDGPFFNPNGERNKPKWSPNATKIVFHHWKYPDDDCEIYVKNVNGGALTQLTNTTGNNGQPSWQPLLPARTLADFDGDGRSDISVFRPSDGTWYLNQSTAGFAATPFGLSTDKITPADYDDDGKTDIAVYRDGIWYLQRSNLGFTGAAFGASTDIPVPADFDGDGKAELAVFRPSNGVWYSYNLATNQQTSFAFGQSGDIPVAADYDGDGKADIAVFRQGIWYVQHSSLGFTGIAFGAATDKPVPADYNGDGKTDVAVFRPDNGVWYLMRSNLGITGIQFGFGTDTPVPADYDGDGKADVAVFRDGTWYLRQSTNGFAATLFGLTNDQPVPAAYLP